MREYSDDDDDENQIEEQMKLFSKKQPCYA